MSAPIAGDQARASVLVKVPPDAAFRIFTEEIDHWWRRGTKYRIAKGRTGTIALEAGVGGRLFESFPVASGEKTIQTGEVTAWDPPHRFVLAWRAVNFRPSDPSTEVEVVFEPSASGTMVTVTHRGWSRIRPDHPARHRQDVVTFIEQTGRWWGGLLIALRDHATP